MKIAVEGCAHGELENIYNSIQEVEEKEKIKIDLLICCGDFQSSRNEEDLRCMAVPEKYYNICSFYKYYNGEKQAPILTIFIGGNHEASNYLQELPYGGWVAPNIYYMGYAGIIDIAGIRIGGLSGIYKGMDYFKGHFEKTPYDDSSKRSVYHVRNLEVFRLKQQTQPIDIFLSHDWPKGVYNFGNTQQLLKRKPFFRDEVERGQLGSMPCEELLNHLKPNYWFSAHLHCKFAALVKHNDKKVTRFLALDKCLPKRKFLQIVDIKHDESRAIEISYDLEWLSILHSTNHLLSVKKINNFMPGVGGNERYDFSPTEEEKSAMLKRFPESLVVPKNFRKTANSYESGTPLKRKRIMQPEAKLNPQTIEFCETLGIDDPVVLVSELKGISLDISVIEDNNTSNISPTHDNTTFISDSDLSMSQSAIESDSVNSSAVLNDSISDISNRSLGKLNLPEPKVSVADNSLIINETSFSNVNNLSLSPSQLESEAVVESESVKSPTEVQDNVEVSAETSPVDDKNLNISDQQSLNEVTTADSEVVTDSPKRTIDVMLQSECTVKDDSTSESTKTSEKVVVSSGTDEGISPLPKKFKRRNADIYQAEDS